MKPWWERGPLTFEGLLIALVIMLLILLAGLLTINTVHAAGCLSIDVPPQAVLSVYDGDTFTLSLGALGSVKVRVEGVDTPEITKKQPRAEEAKLFTQQWLANGPFKLTTCFALTLGRVVGNPSRNGRTLAQDLIAAGLAK